MIDGNKLHTSEDILALARYSPILNAVAQSCLIGNISPQQMMIEMVYLQAERIIELEDFLTKKMLAEPMRIEVTSEEYRRILNLVSKNE